MRFLIFLLLMVDLPVLPKTEQNNEPPRRVVAQEDPKDETFTFFGEEISMEQDSVIFVADRSASMIHEGRMLRAKEELTRSIQGLSENISFNIIFFDCTMMQFKPQVVEANEENKAHAVAWVNSILLGGGTGSGPAVAMALNDKENMLVVLLTDGQPTCGFNTEEHLQLIKAANTQGARIDVFGISAYGEYRAWCQKVASKNGGNYYDVG